MIKKLFILAIVFVLISLVIMATTKMHLMSLCFAGFAFCIVGFCFNSIEQNAKNTNKIKGMLFHNGRIVKY